MFAPHHRSTVVLAAALLATTGLAGCIGNLGDESDLAWSSYDEAQDAEGPVFEPNGTSSVRVKWLMPATPDAVPKGQSNIFLLVFDSETDEPITDAEISLASHMPAMGHGTAAETDPTHVDFGVYKGVINPSMGGQWLLNLKIGLASGEQLDVQIGYNVQGGMDGGMDGGHGGMDGDGWNPSSPYASYDEAQDTEGPVFEPENATGPHRLKLLSPPDPTDVPKEHRNVTVLLFDEEADTPVEDANLTLDAYMTAMGHGTSPEDDPVHTQNGVYMGRTTFSMEGKWRLDIDATLSDGTGLSWRIPVDVGNVSESWGDPDPGPPFEPYNRSFESDVQSTDYNESHVFDVKGANATIDVTFTLGNSTMLVDELTLDLLSPDGENLGSATVNSDTDEDTITVDAAPVEGDYTARVTGQALDAHYIIDIRVAPPAS